MAYRNIESGKVLEYIKNTYLGKVVHDSRSPAGNWLGFTLEHIEKGAATLLIPIRKEMTNPYGNIHGGMMSLLIDEAIGWAVVSLDADNHYTSMSLNVDFLYAIKEGDTVRAASRIIRQGKKIVHAECYVYDLAGNILAHATSNLIVTHMDFAGN
jgi:acyl-coenzyme A thioesterase 13